MKIAMVCALWGPAYPTGSGIYAYELSRRLAEEGHEVHVFTSNTGEFNGTKYPSNLHLHKLKSHGLIWDMNPLSNAFSKIVNEDFDIVHVHSYIFFLSNSVAFAKAFKKFNYVLTFHGGVDYQSSNCDASTRFWLKDNFYDRTLGYSTVKMADKVISVCKKDIPIIKEKFDAEAQYVPNAVCTSRFSYHDNNSRTIMFVGKLEKWKGAADLCDIFRIVNKKLPDVKFRIVGDGSLAKEFLASDLPIEFMGYVPHDIMPQYYGSSCLSVLPSYMEGSPTTCMESLACGVPVVATNVGDTSDVVLDGKSGFIHSPGDIAGMADSIISLLNEDSLRKKMGREGRRHIEDNYSYNSILPKMKTIYSTLLQEGRSIGQI